MVSGLRAVLVEAFSEEPLGGNGAAVVLLEEPAPAEWMQRVAGRLRQSETAFLLELAGSWALRWFTPTQEVPLCGHATLGATLALGHWGLLEPEGSTSLHSRSGPLPVQLLSPSPGRTPQGVARASLELPSSRLVPQEPPAGLPALLKGRLGLEPEGFWQGHPGYQVVLLPAAADLAGLEGLAGDLCGTTRNGLVVMQALPAATDPGGTVEGEGADYQLRFFAPGLGIEEDPVTGSAHALVAPFWMERLQRPRVVGWQCSDRPGGMVCEARSSGMIRLIGSGHLLWEGTLQAWPEHGWPPSGGQPAEPSAAAGAWRLACGL